MTHVSAPPAVEPFYACARRNEPIVLFSGRVDLVAARTEQHCGGIVLDWLPSPSLRCWVRGPSSELGLQAVMGSTGVEIVPRLPQRTVPQQSTIGDSRSITDGFEADSRLFGIECGNADAQLSYAVFHVANFPDLNGSPVTWPDGSTVLGQLLFEGGGWSIVMDPAPGTDTLHKELREHGGFGLTHTARIQRTSGAPFSTSELKMLIEAFTYFCWLCAETRCGPLLPVGFDGHRSAVWSRWNAARTESFTPAATWLDDVHADEAQALFPSFMIRFGDPYWRQVVRHAVGYLLEAGRPDTLQRAIVMAQILLEALSYSWLVEECAIRTTDSFEGRTAAQNIRAMLQDMDIPITMPAGFAALAGTRTTGGRPASDGPHALVLTRNEIIHRRRGRTGSDGADPAASGEGNARREVERLTQAWQLGGWYSELAVLRMCGFTGLYRSRLSDEVHVGAVEPVPWQAVSRRRRPSSH